MVAKEKVF